MQSEEDCNELQTEARGSDIDSLARKLILSSLKGNRRRGFIRISDTLTAGYRTLIINYGIDIDR
jgi:hypothetical protein